LKLVIVGSVALDAVKTPYGEVDCVLGGSAVYASIASRNFCKTGIVGVVGNDFPKAHVKLLEKSGICLEGLQEKTGKTFYWKGVYNNLNCAETLDTRLNVFADFNPVIPEKYQNCDFLFLGNIDPILQLQVLDQVKDPILTAADTMNFWINSKRQELMNVIRRIDVLFINEEEIRMLTEEKHVLKAAQIILEMGPKLIVVKRGEYGALAYGDDFLFFSPIYPVMDVIDPTGAGDSFAGGFMGYLAAAGEINQAEIRKAMMYGTVAASFCVEDFSVNKLKQANTELISKRLQKLREYVEF
jgi:sugar/nucleoside kinase (ribokinase family)